MSYLWNESGAFGERTFKAPQYDDLTLTNPDDEGRLFIFFLSEKLTKFLLFYWKLQRVFKGLLQTLKHQRKSQEYVIKQLTEKWALVNAVDEILKTKLWQLVTFNSFLLKEAERVGKWWSGKLKSEETLVKREPFVIFQ